MTNDSYIYQGNSHRIFHVSIQPFQLSTFLQTHFPTKKKSNTFHGDGVHEAEPVKSHCLYTHDSAYFGRVKCEVHKPSQLVWGCGIFCPSTVAFTGLTFEKPTGVTASWPSTFRIGFETSWPNVKLKTYLTTFFRKKIILEEVKMKAVWPTYKKQLDNFSIISIQ